MTQTDTLELSTPSRFRNRWAWFPVGLLGLLVSVQAVLFKLSSGDESFAIESDYYQKAVDWDARARERQMSEHLGWQAHSVITSSASGSMLRVELLDASARPLTAANVTVDAFPNARANQVQHLALQEVGPGTYENTLRLTHTGEWEIRVTARSEKDTFTQTLRTRPSL